MSITTNNHIEDYIDYCKFEVGHRPATLKTNANLLYRFNAYLLSLDTRVEICGVPEKIFLNFIDHLTNKNCSESTINHNKSIISGFFKFLERAGRLKTGFIPCNRKFQRKLYPILTVQEVEKMCSSCPVTNLFEIRDRALIEMCYSCGFRVSEVTNLKILDILSDDTVLINGKGGKQRIGIINPSARYWVKKYIRLKQDAGIDSPFVFTSYVHKKLFVNAVQTIIHRASIRAGIKVNVTTHTLRRTFATHLLDGGMDILHIARLMGHTSVVTTQYYILLESKHKKQTYELHPRERIEYKDDSSSEDAVVDSRYIPQDVKLKSYSVKLSDDFKNSLPSDLQNKVFYKTLTDFFQSEGRYLCYKKRTHGSLVTFAKNHEIHGFNFDQSIIPDLTRIGILKLCSARASIDKKSSIHLYEVNKLPGIIITRDSKNDKVLKRVKPS